MAQNLSGIDRNNFTEIVKGTKWKEEVTSGKPKGYDFRAQEGSGARWRMEAQRVRTPKLFREDLKIANAKPDQLQAAAEIPIGPPHSPEPHSTDA